MNLREELQAGYARQIALVRSMTGRQIIKADLVEVDGAERIEIVLGDGRTIRIEPSEWLMVSEQES